MWRRRWRGWMKEKGRRNGEWEVCEVGEKKKGGARQRKRRKGVREKGRQRKRRKELWKR